MSEPVYTFKKGEGWVLETIKTLDAIDRNGKRLRLEFRQPRFGEHFFNPGAYNDTNIIEHVGYFDYKTFAVLDQFKWIKPEPICVVLVPV